MKATWLATVLRSAGVPVVEHDGWKIRGNGELLDVRGVVWHHDASAPGYSPNMAGYILRQVDAGMAGANIWVTLDGTWHLIAAGKTYHAGKVLTGKLNNSTSLGIETDHTTNETWSGVQLLQSLRVGTAAILSHIGRDVLALEFHKTVCDPPGRKTDPDGLTLAVERNAVAALLHPSGDDMFEYRVVKIEAPKNGMQLVGHDVNNLRLGKFHNDVTVTIKANDNGTPVPACVQVVKNWDSDDLVLSFVGLNGQPAPSGLVGVVLSHPPR